MVGLFVVHVKAEIAVPGRLRIIRFPQLGLNFGSPDLSPSLLSSYINQAINKHYYVKHNSI